MESGVAELAASLPTYQFSHFLAKRGKCIEIFGVLVVLLSLSNSVASSEVIVQRLPGFHGELPFLLETGYIGVGEDEDVQLFYYFIQSGGEPARDPLVLWLTGGPGCSALYSLMYGTGPLGFDYKKSNEAQKPVLELNDYSWTKVANIIFLDAPVGTGFSYATTSEGYNTSDTKSTENTYEFLRKWILAHPKFHSNPVYIGGESYSGITVPAIVKRIVDGQESVPAINLKGYILGNPFTDADYDLNARVKFANKIGLVSDEIYEKTKLDCDGGYAHPNTSDAACVKDLETVNQCVKDVYHPMILEPKCRPISSKPNKLKWGLSPLVDNFSDELLSEANPIGNWCRNYNYLWVNIWANDKQVQEALHVRNGTIKEWERCRKNLSYVFDIKSSLEYHRSLLDKYIRVLVYSGDHDLIVPYVGTEEWTQSLNLTVSSDYVWRPWYLDSQIAGYTVIYSNARYTLTFATIKGAGHIAPEYNPKECLNMISRWLAYFFL